MNQELVITERAREALSSARTEATLLELASKYTDVVEIRHEDDARFVTAAVRGMVQHRTRIEKAGRAAREDAIALQKAILAEERRLCGIIRPEEDRLKLLKREWEMKKEAEAREAHEREMARQAAIREKIAGFGQMVRDSVGTPAAQVRHLIEALNTMVIEKEEFEEYTAQAQNALDMARLAARGVLTQSQMQEDRAAIAAAMIKEEARQTDRQEIEQDRQFTDTDRLDWLLWHLSPNEWARLEVAFDMRPIRVRLDEAMRKDDAISDCLR